MARFGLIGKNISYSFSKGYFQRKFSELKLDGYSYENFDLQQIDDFKSIFALYNDLHGLNVTIPYKEAIIPYLDELDTEAAKIGAVNTIKITPHGLKGFNTDVYGFHKSLVPRMGPAHTKALILGTGGASKAVAHVLREIGVHFNYVSRRPSEGQLSYSELNRELINDHLLIINTTPLGTHPNINDKPPLPYNALTPGHLLFDLIYNPEKTSFLLEGEKRGAQIQNGLKMLELQAEKSWEIWNEKSH